MSPAKFTCSTPIYFALDRCKKSAKFFENALLHVRAGAQRPWHGRCGEGRPLVSLGGVSSGVVEWCVKGKKKCKSRRRKKSKVIQNKRTLKTKAYITEEKRNTQDVCQCSRTWPMACANQEIPLGVSFTRATLLQQKIIQEAPVPESV